MDGYDTRVGSGQRVPVSQAILPAGWTMSEVQEPHAPVSGHASFWSIDEMIASRMECIDCRIARTGAISGPGSIRLRLTTGGTVEGTVDGRTIHLETGDVTFEHSGIHADYDCRNYSSVSVSLPASLVGYDRSRHIAWAKAPQTSTTAKMLANILRGYFDLLPEASVEEAGCAATMWTPIVASSLDLIARFGQRADDDHARKLTAIKEYIEDNLGQPDLDVTAIVKAFPVSRAVAYRLFKHEGGIARYIQDRRLSRAAKLLAYSTQGETVSEVAAKVGFANPSHFTRVFKTRFGLSPTAVRAVAEREDGPVEDVSAALAEELRKVLRD